MYITLHHQRFLCVSSLKFLINWWRNPPKGIMTTTVMMTMIVIMMTTMMTTMVMALFLMILMMTMTMMMIVCCWWRVMTMITMMMKQLMIILYLFSVDRGQCRGPRHSVDRQRPARLCHDLAHLFHHGRPLLQGYLRPMRRWVRRSTSPHRRQQQVRVPGEELLLGDPADQLQ